MVEETIPSRSKSTGRVDISWTNGPISGRGGMESHRSREPGDKRAQTDKRHSQGRAHGGASKKALRASTEPGAKGFTNGTGLTNPAESLRASAEPKKNERFSRVRSIVDTSHLRTGMFSGGNGLTNGTGITNGNGMTNGNGLTNGNRKQGHRRYHYKQTGLDRIKRRFAKERIVASITIAVLIMLPAMAYSIDSAYDGSIAIDGDFSDWKDIEVHMDDIRDTENSNIDIMGISTHSEPNWAYIYVVVMGSMFTGNQVDVTDGIYLFIDSDDDHRTGYAIEGIGADLRIEIYGVKEKIVEISGMKYDDSVEEDDQWERQRDWNCFSEDISVAAATDGSAMEVALHEHYFDGDGRLMVVSMDANGNRDASDILLGMDNNIRLPSPMEIPPSFSEYITIDGKFDDWSPLPAFYDTRDQRSNENLDIKEYKMYEEDEALSFYLRVDGSILEGTYFPVLGKEFEMTDNIPTNRLEPREDEGESKLPVMCSDDAVKIFLDTDIRSSTGFQVGGIGAEYQVVIKGSSSNVYSRQILEWDDGWEDRGSEVLAAAEGSRLELQFSPLPGTIDGFRVVMMTADWLGNWDTALMTLDEVLVATWSIKGSTGGSSSGTTFSNLESGEDRSRGQLQKLVTGMGANGGDRFGWNVSYAGDVNQDGFDDLVVGAPFNDTSDGSRVDAGAAYVFFGYNGIHEGDINASNANITIYGTNSGDLFGWDVAGIGDVDGDDVPDILVGAPGLGLDRGRAYIFFGDNLVNEVASGADVILTCLSDNYLFGHSVASAGDVNGDDNDDVIIGAHGGNEAYIYFGGNGMGVGEANITVSGKMMGDEFGFCVGGAGDVNGDNFADVIIGAPGTDSDTGRAYIIHGDSNQASKISVSNANVNFTGESTGDRFGHSVNGTGDLNGDNHDDVIIGAPGYSSARGRAYVYLGSESMMGELIVPTFEDTFENDLSKWNGNGPTNWFLTSDQSHGGSQSVSSARFSDGFITSDDIDLSGASSASLDFWHRKSLIEVNDFELYFYDGVTYNEIRDLDGEGPDDTWLHYNNITIDLSTYGISNFRVRFNGVMGPSERVWIDDLVLWSGTRVDADYDLTGSSVGDRFGQCVYGNIDMDDDGNVDIMVGAPYVDHDSLTDCGAVYVFSGDELSSTSADNAHHTAYGTQADSCFGHSISSAGDIMGDGSTRALIGAPYYNDTFFDPNKVDTGKAYVLDSIPEFSQMVMVDLMVFVISIVFISRRRRTRRGAAGRTKVSYIK